MKRILFTSVGRRVELLTAFREAADRLDEPLLLCGTDITGDAPALRVCDRYFLTSRIRSDSYIPELLDICGREKIDLLIPTIDTDLLVLSENREKFEEIGTRVLISAPDKIRICRDKRNTAAFFISCGVRSPLPVDRADAYEGGFPCFIKPRDGSSSINAHRADSEEELALYASTVPDYIIQPFVSGREYTIDIFCDFDGKPVYITPRERIQVRSGEVIKTAVVQDEVMIGEAERIVAGFHPVGPITVQLIRDEQTGEDWFIEINPRFGGGSPLSMLAGADSAEAALLLLRGETPGYRREAAADGLEFSRFDRAFVSAGNEPVKVLDYSEIPGLAEGLDVVLFDLDDTLYDETDYVKSGFAEAARLAAGELSGRTEEELFGFLWEAYQSGRAPVDELADLLYKERRDGPLPEEIKRILLSAYRDHAPEIRLKDGAEAVLSALSERGIRIGIVTDGRPGGQRAKLKALGLSDDPRIAEVISTDELAGGSGRGRIFRKPNPLAFEIMRARFGTAFCRMAYVGDNAGKDFIAPARLGMKCILLRNPRGLYQRDMEDR